MNIILLTCIIFTLALVHGRQGTSFIDDTMTSNLAPNRSEPCKGKSNRAKYNNFTKNHILKRDFDTSSEEAWRRYLRKFKLCGRARVQSFINKADKKKVMQICSRAGGRLQGNLCISRSPMTVHDVLSNKSCSFVSVNETNHYVIVACDKIGRECLPVHYEKYDNEHPGNKSCILKFCQA